MYFNAGIFFPKYPPPQGGWNMEQMAVGKKIRKKKKKVKRKKSRKRKEKGREKGRKGRRNGKIDENMGKNRFFSFFPKQLQISIFFP